MNILLVQPNLNRSNTGYQEGADVPAPAPGIMYVSSYLKAHGFHVNTLNMNHYPTTKLDEIMRKKRYDVVCSGGIFTHLTKYVDIISVARQYNKHVKTVIGGPVATAHPEFALDALQADFLVIGEGERTCADLLTAIADNRKPNSVKGIAFRDQDQFVQTEANQPIEDLDTLPFPDYEGFEFDRFLDLSHDIPQDYPFHFIYNNRPVGVVGGRDCPGKCTFCFRLTGGKFRVRSVDNIIDEIRYLVDRFGINTLGLVDDLFATKKARVREFCRKIQPMNLPWQCALRVNNIDEEMLMAMKAAGCVLVSYGFESGSATVLKSMKKGISVGQIEKAIELTRKARMTIQGNFIFGDPAETLETAKETLRLARRYKCLHLGKMFIKPYPGSQLYHDLVDRKAIKDLHHFWVHSTREVGSWTINMTRLNEREFFLLRSWVALENLHRNYYKVLKVEPQQNRESYAPERRNIHIANCGVRQHIKNMVLVLSKLMPVPRSERFTYTVTLECPLCRSTFERIVVKHHGTLPCPNCFMRSYVDAIDLNNRNAVTKQIHKSARSALIMFADILLSSRPLGLRLARLWTSFFSNIRL